MILFFFPQENCGFVIYRFLIRYLNFFLKRKIKLIISMPRAFYPHRICDSLVRFWRSTAFYYKVTLRSDEEKEGGGEKSPFTPPISLCPFPRTV